MSTIDSTVNPFNLIPYGGGKLAARYMQAAAVRTETLNIARLCSALTWPFVLPQMGQNAQMRLPEAYQSIGALGMLNMVGKGLSAMYPADGPFFSLETAAEIEYSRSVTEQQKKNLADDLFMCQMIAHSVLDSQHLDDKDNRHRRAVDWRGRKTFSLANLFVTGDTLERMTDDNRLQVFRRDQYITLRDSCGDPLSHGIYERVDPMSWDDPKDPQKGPRMRAKCKFKDSELKEKDAIERMCDLFTFVDWQPWTNTWVITQECQGEKFNESQETVTPYISTPYRLVPGEHYGRGFVETTVLPDLRSFNNLRLRALDWAALASDKKLCLDQSCEASDEDFMRPSGSILRSMRVNGAEVQDAAYLGVGQLADFKVMQEVTMMIRGDLGRAMMMESEMTPSKERTTAYQVSRIVAELDGATGGQWSTMQGENQTPTARRLVHNLRKDNRLPMFPDGHVRVNVMTGAAAVAKQATLAKILQTADILSKMGPEAQAQINIQTLADLLQRYQNFYEPTLIYTPAEMQAKAEQQIKNATTQAANEQIIGSAGKIAENRLAQ